MRTKTEYREFTGVRRVLRVKRERSANLRQDRCCEEELRAICHWLTLRRLRVAMNLSQKTCLRIAYHWRRAPCGSRHRLENACVFSLFFGLKNDMSQCGSHAVYTGYMRISAGHDGSKNPICSVFFLSPSVRAHPVPGWAAPLDPPRAGRMERCQALKNLAGQGSKNADKGACPAASGRNLHLRLTRQAKIAASLSQFLRLQGLSAVCAAGINSGRCIRRMDYTQMNGCGRL